MVVLACGGGGSPPPRAAGPPPRVELVPAPSAERAEPPTPALSAREAELVAKVEALEAQMAAIEEQLAAQPPAPPPLPRLDPTATYGLTIDGAPSRGHASAPVVIVKAYEYASSLRRRTLSRKNKFTDEQIIRAAREVDGGAKASDVCRRLGITEQTLDRSRQRFGGMDVS